MRVTVPPKLHDKADADRRGGMGPIVAAVAWWAVAAVAAVVLIAAVAIYGVR